MEDTALYRPILKKSWQITKKFKNLWFFGLFAAILGVGGEYEILSRAITNPQTEGGIINQIRRSFELGWQEGLTAVGGGGFWSNLWSAITNNPQAMGTALVVFILTTILAIFLFWLAIISQIGLIRNITLIHQNKKATLNEGIDFAIKNFWPVLFINILMKLAVFILFFILGREIILLTRGDAVSLIIYFLSFVIFITIVFVIYFLLRYQIYYLLLQQQKFNQALKSAWQLLKNNWLVSLEMAFFLFVIYLLAVIIATFIIALLFAAPFVVVYFFPILSPLIGQIILATSALLIIAIVIFTFSIVSVFQWAAWTILFDRLAGSGAVSKIMRGSQQLTNIFSHK